MPQFVRDVEEIRRRAINKIEQGAVTGAYRGDLQRNIAILNEALATEIVCVLRYMHHYFMATGVHGRSVADEFKEHADSEREHADAIAERIQQLGGKPDFNPRSLVERSASQYVEGETLGDMIREDLIAERVVIEVYTDMIRHFGDKDPTTRILLERILRDEEEHASDLVDLLYVVDPKSGETAGVDPGTDPLSRKALFSQREAGRTFAASDKPEPPRPIRSREEERGGRGRRGRRGGRRQSGDASTQPLQPHHFRGEEQQGTSPPGERQGKREGRDGKAGRGESKNRVA